MSSMSLGVLPLLAQAAEPSQSFGAAFALYWDWVATAAVFVLALVGLGVFSYTTRAGIIARATTKEAVRQPVFLLLMAVAIVLLVVNTILPFFSLGEDVKMLKDCGLATLLISGLLLAVWTASTSIANEIEGKTAMTLLSKPINRRQFVIGKYIGIIQSVLWLLLPLSITFCLLVYFKVGYDAKESGEGALPYWDPDTMMPNLQRLQGMLQVIPGLLLITLEISVLAAVSVAISTRVPMVVNVVSCLAIFVVGHLAPQLVRSEQFSFEAVEFVAKLIATVLPSLEMFNTQAAVATGRLVPPAYLGYSALYCAAYTSAAILLAFILFEDRDLA